MAKDNKPKGKLIWKILCGVFAFLFAFLMIAGPIANNYATIINMVLGIEGSTIVGDAAEDLPPRFVSDFEDSAAQAAAADLVCESVVANGAVLLLNRNNALPLSGNEKVSLLGTSSARFVYGGTGSGSVDTSKAPNLKQALEAQGITINQTLWDLYKSDSMMKNYSRITPASISDTLEANTQYAVNEAPWSALSSAESSFAEYGDAAIVVFSRSGGEGADLPTDMSAVVDGSWIRRVAEYRGSEKGAGYYNGTYDDTLNEGNDWDKGDHFLQLSNREEELIDLVTSNFDNVVVVYNGANAFEMDWVKDYPQIKGVLLCPGTGQSGFEGFGRVVAGEVNPSGRTADTYAADLTASPWWNNFGDFKYTNTSEFNSNASGFDPEGTTPSFVNYVEGIYVGYKFYETAADEGLIDYDKEVVYPFGYGLSYTTFTQKMSDITSDGSSLKFSVTVTNTGSAAGKDVVEIYNDPPYTNGGIEKASANLLDFAKTGELAPGESETIDFTIPVEDLASYDYKNNGCYVLEAGDYIISTNSDSHNVLDSKTYTVASDIVYNESNKRESDAVAATNQFDFAEGEITYLSRADGFANYDEATAAPATYEMSDEVKAGFENCFTYTESGYEKDEMFHDNQTLMRELSKLWIKVKAAK